jgi:hypothetical protein
MFIFLKEFALTSNLIGGIHGLAINRSKLRAAYSIQVIKYV